ncbi:MAG: septum formation initiator family protein [Defluviitaleaceae bacterium]|nr:septum formation initiator family protein [Defluviitaleaceae bacterium]
MAKNSQEKLQNNKLRNIICILFCVFVLTAALVYISRQTAAYNDLRARNERTQQDLARQVAIYEDLTYQMTNFDSDAYIEALARARFGWVRGDEIVFRMVTD